jgi:hypothetical protein
MSTRIIRSMALMAARSPPSMGTRRSPVCKEGSSGRSGIRKTGFTVADGRDDR